MTYNGLKILASILLTVVLSAVLPSCKGRAMSGMLVITQVPVSSTDADFCTGESWRYLTGARLAAVDPDRPGKIRVLTGNFFSACSPDISYDGRFMLFSGRQSESDSWQIWEMDLRKMKTRKITSFTEDCTDPSYLPDGRMVFSKYTENDTVKISHSLFTCKLDGSALNQLTFSPVANFATTVLKDGRLLTVSRQLLPEHGNPVLMVLRPDGTKADLFYKGSDSIVFLKGGAETDDGRIFFIENTRESLSGGTIASVSYNQPLNSRADHTSSTEGAYLAVLPLHSNEMLVSYKKPGTDHYALYEFDNVRNTTGKIVLDDPDYNVFDIARVMKYERPRNLPSEVDMMVKTGLLFCQDINVRDIRMKGNPGKFGKVHMIEVLGTDTTYGKVTVEMDGSFQLKVIADTPFRIRTLDDSGNVESGPCAWLWLRPNERRGCVGCHEDPEIVPENRLAEAVKKPPVVIPTYFGEIKEKTVELE